MEARNRYTDCYGNINYINWTVIGVKEYRCDDCNCEDLTNDIVCSECGSTLIRTVTTDVIVFTKAIHNCIHTIRRTLPETSVGLMKLFDRIGTLPNDLWQI